MRAVVQRVSQASVTVDGQVAGAIEEPGLLVLVGVTHGDMKVALVNDGPVTIVLDL